MTAQIIQLKNATKLYGSDVVIDRVKLTPGLASEWLKANRNNRPLSRAHVGTLAKQMQEGHWLFNAQPIVISNGETVLDGQHRLHAVIESGVTIEALVVYGVAEEAFTTIDTGKTRNGRDVLCMMYPDTGQSIAQSVSAAARFSILFLGKTFARKEKISNPEILEFVAKNPALWRMAEDIHGWKTGTTPLGEGHATALYWLFSQKNREVATEFMKQLITGEDLRRQDAVWIARDKLIGDKSRQVRWGFIPKTKLVIKAWNAHRKGGPSNAQAVQPKTSDPKWIAPK